LFGDVAITLLKMMGHSGTVPGALPAAGIPAAIERLHLALATAGDHEKKPGPEPAASDPDEPAPVGLGLRAYPLIQLLTAAAQRGCDVMWDLGAPRI